MGNKSVVSEGRQISLAIELIELGARLQLLETETTLSRERLLKLYKELRGVSPPKGMLPFSTDWFITWQPNIHASVFMGIYRYLTQHAGVAGIDAIIKAYRLYLEQMPPEKGAEPLLSLTRAWTLIRFYENRMLTLVECGECHGHFVSHTFELHSGYRCGLCHPPSRAGKKKKTDVVAEAIPA
ncbi:MAG: flagellar transcriptional regulator FlhC [Burkholderiaceae bacterium]|jgi:flagellar transcriptional activator FlhC|nr:flagellar transcriptional regulator FlhC [Burkholderiaceae bacterium]